MIIKIDGTLFQVPNMKTEEDLVAPIECDADGKITATFGQKKDQSI